MMLRLWSMALFMPCNVMSALAPSAQTQTARIQLLTRDGSVVERLTDGDEIRLKIGSPNGVRQVTRVTFLLDRNDPTIAECTIQAGSDTCQTEPLLSLGWYWDQQGQPQPRRHVVATSVAFAEVASTTIRVAPRPVVLVHGLASNAGTWSRYLGPSGLTLTFPSLV
jgi:hypothetical protein